jgi:hypothetical protein
MERKVAVEKINRISKLFEEFRMLDALSTSIEKCRASGLKTDDTIFENIKKRKEVLLLRLDDLLK